MNNSTTNTLSATERLSVLKLSYDIACSQQARRICYVDVGNMPKEMSDKYIKDVTNFEEKLQYDSSGEILKGKRSIVVPRRENGKGTSLDFMQGFTTASDVLKIANELVDFCEF